MSLDNSAEVKKNKYLPSALPPPWVFIVQLCLQVYARAGDTIYDTSKNTYVADKRVCILGSPFYKIGK